MKKTSKYAQKKKQAEMRAQADPSSIYRVMNRIQPFTRDEQLELSMPPRVAFESMRSGRGTEFDFHTLAAVANCALVCGEKIGKPCVDAAKLAQESLVMMLDRHVRLGKWGGGCQGAAKHPSGAGPARATAGALHAAANAAGNARDDSQNAGR